MSAAVSDQTGAHSAQTTTAAALPWRLVTSVAAANLLNPLNSSMIAVALLALSAAFGVEIAAATWLVSAFYLGGAVGMPLMGRLADVFGPRRIFSLGLVLVGLSSALAPLAPALAWLVGLRVALALGTSAAYPAGLAIFRRYLGRQRPPAGALGVISVASSVSAAIGPVLGGALVALGGWQAIFLVNLPVAAVGLVLAWRWLPADPTRAAPAAGDRAPPQPAIGRRLEPRSALRLPRAGEIRNSLWRTLLAQRAIAGICCQFGAVNVVFYSVFFGFPLWLEAARAYGPEATGLLVLPVAGVGVLTTPLAARLINRSGARPALVVGSTLLLAGSLLMLVFDDTTPLLVLLVVGAVLGVPNAFNNLGLQAALYQAAPAAQMGSAGGVFQTFRYLGAIGATALVGLVFGASPTSDGLHTLAAVMAVISAGLLASSLWRASRAPAQ